MSRIGIGIPVYNGEGSLLKTLWSIRAQTFTDYTLYIIDDGSTDSTWEVIKEGIRMFSEEQVHIHRHKTNLGIQKTRNDLFNFYSFYGSWKNPSIEYFIYVDDDLGLNPAFLFTLISALDMHPKTAYAYCDFQWKGHFQHRQQAIPFDSEVLRQQPYISMMSMFRMSCLLQVEQPLIDEELERLEDWALFLKLLNHGYQGLYIPGFMGFYAYSKEGDNSARGIKDYRRWEAIVKQKYNRGPS